MDLTKSKEQLKELQIKISAYDHALGLIYYDGVTGAPRETAENRARTTEVLNADLYRLTTGEETVALLTALDEAQEARPDAFTPEEKRQIFLLLKEIRTMQKIPMEEYVAYQSLLVQSEDVWHRAKEENDFASFAPYLEKIFDTNRKFAGYIAPEKDPYDYWLGEYEDGLDRKTCDAFFDTLRSRLVPLLAKIAKAPQVGNDVLHGHFPEAAQDALSRWVMAQMGLDAGHVGLGMTEHPFTISLGSHQDVRITTHYYENDYSSSLFSVIHEGGHALYDTGSRDDFAATVLDGGVSMGIHESQSRFYENILGRNKQFCSFLFPKLTEFFPQLSAYTAEDLYKALNRAEPSLIRTEADEFTYCLHVMVRYELEKKVMDGELAVKDLPEAWNKLYKEYLGVDVPDDTHGVLQDSHWSGGSVGYFPSYALGSAYGAQFLHEMKKTVDVDACLAKGDFGPINAWNRDHIWQHGSLYKPGELLRRVLGCEFDPKYYAEYLEQKAKDVYGIE